MKNRLFQIKRMIARIVAPVMLTCAILTGCQSSAAESNKLGEKAMQEANYKEALVAFDQAQKQDEGNVLYKNNKGLALLELDQAEEAKACFMKVLELDAKNRDAYRGLGIACMKLGEYSEAIDAFDQAADAADILVNETDFDAMEYKAEAMVRCERYEDALSVYSALILLEYHTADNYYRRGNVRLLLGDKDNAIIDFSVCSEAAEYINSAKMIEIYYALAGAGVIDAAEAYLVKAGEYAATEDDRNLVLAEQEMIRGNYENALEAFLKVSTAGIKPPTVLSKATCYETLERYEEAAASYEDYVSAYGGNLSVYNHLGICYTELGDYEQAIIYIRRAIAEPDCVDYPQIQWNLVAAYEKMGRNDLAMVALTEYLKNYPDDTKGQQELEYLKGLETEL